MRTSASRATKVAAVTEPRATQGALDEKRLVERAKAGDRAALGMLLSHHGPKLYRCVLLPRLGSEARARDALSATYEKAIERLALYDWQPCGIYPWLRVVAMHIALDMIRASRREVLFQSEDLAREIDVAESALQRNQGTAHYDQVQEQHDLDHARRRVRDALERINPRYAQAIRLRVLEERPREEVASTMGVSAATFDVLLHRSLAALKKALATDAPERQEP
ncbi:MAG: RNA polymerase sigma factor [Deltaproteobacteria bacterium]|nr:RNA polymerase sigma factor [Deltaproteobacteria bacterium]